MTLDARELPGLVRDQQLTFACVVEMSALFCTLRRCCSSSERLEEDAGEVRGPLDAFWLLVRRSSRCLPLSFDGFFGLCLGLRLRSLS